MTTSVVLNVPEGVTVLSATAPDGGTYDMARVAGRVVSVTWTVNIPPGSAAQLSFEAQNPAAGSDIVWPVHQKCASMSPTELADVSGSTYTYLMNGTAPAGNWTGLFTPGERVRLRFVNASAMSYFDVRIPGLKMTVVAADGNYVHPVSVDEFRMAVAETFDVIVEPTGQDAFTIFAQSIDRTGFAAGTLAVREGLQAPVPDVDPRELLTMMDMGMSGGAMSGHDMAAMGGAPAGAPAAADPHAGHTMPGQPSAAKPEPAEPAAADPHAGHTMPMGTTSGAPAQPPAAGAQGGHDMSKMGGMEGMDKAGGMQMHPESENGNPLVDNQAMNPTSRLDDPGVGLRGNGRKVLTYADLHSLFDDPDGREPGRTIELHLTGPRAWHYASARARRRPEAYGSPSGSARGFESERPGARSSSKRGPSVSSSFGCRCGSFRLCPHRPHQQADADGDRHQ